MRRGTERWMDGWMDGWMDALISWVDVGNQWDYRYVLSARCVCVDGWIWMDMDGWVDG